MSEPAPGAARSARGLVAALLVAASAAALLAACTFQIDPGGAQLSCEDGRCPSGMNCIAGRCVPLIDAGEADANLAPDAGGTSPTCGNGVVDDPREQCDDGPASDTDACLGTCRFATCGDGFVRAGVEACDPGIDDTCPANCQPCGGRVQDGHCYEAGSSCNYDCAEQTCLQQRGGHLLTVSSTAENALPSLMLVGVQEAWLWIDSPTRYLTGEPVTFEQWGAGQPAAFDPAIRSAGIAANTGDWRTLDRTTIAEFIICEYEFWFTSPIDNRAYRVDWRREGFSSAGIVCDQLGGKLAVAETSAERAWLVSTLPDGQYHLGDGTGGCTLLELANHAEQPTGAPCVTTPARTLCELP